MDSFKDILTENRLLFRARNRVFYSASTNQRYLSIHYFRTHPFSPFGGR